MKRFILFIGLVIVPLISFSQQESYYTLYRYNMNVINPAYAGALGKNVFAFTSRRQWSSMQDAPSTLAFSYSSVIIYAAVDWNLIFSIQVLLGI